jgi:hypothetical protein
MYLGTANIRNYPDMPTAKVVADALEMSRYCDIWGMQENDPDEDAPAIMRALNKGWPNLWSVVHEDTDVPIFYKKTLFTLTGRRKVTVPLEPDLPLVAKPRTITGVTLKLNARPGLESFVVTNRHYIAGGYNGPTEAKRAQQWDVEYAYDRQFVRGYKLKGKTVFGVGDWNRARPPKPTANWQWLVGEHLDKVGVSTTGPVEVLEIDDGGVELNSDHWGQWTRCFIRETR